MHLVEKIRNAICEGDMLQTMLGIHALENIDAMCGDYTCLMDAVVFAPFYVIEEIIRRGADVNLPNSGGYTSLHYACQAERCDDIVKLLIRSGANVNAVAGDDSTPLLLAIVARETNVAKLLIQSGADVNAIAEDGSTPLSLAIATENTTIIQMLTQYMGVSNSFAT